MTRFSILLAATVVFLAAPVAQASVVGSIGSGAAPNEFSGNQGQDGWFYGYWNRTADANKIYTATPGGTDELTKYPGGAGMGAWANNQQWTGTKWEYRDAVAGAGNPPFLQTTSVAMHPDSFNPGFPILAEKYPIVRYEVQPFGGITADIGITGFFDNVSTAGNGTNGRIFHNGVEASGSPYFQNGALSVISELLLGVKPGDFLDFMVDHAGTPGAQNQETSDGTLYQFVLDATNIQTADGVVIPEPSTFIITMLGVLGFGFCSWRRRRLHPG